MSNDDEYDYLDREMDSGSTFEWKGRLDGGPWDGVEFRIDAPSASGMRGMRFQFCLGDDVPQSQWHVYHLVGQTFDPQTGPRLICKHLGALDGNPEDWPKGSRPDK